MIQDHVRWNNLITGMATKWSSLYNLPFEDCYENLCIAYCEALRSYDPNNGCPFDAYFYNKRRGVLSYMLRNRDDMPLADIEDISIVADKRDALSMVLFRIDLSHINEDLVKVLDYILEKGVEQTPERNVVGVRMLKKGLMSEYGWSTKETDLIVKKFGECYKTYAA